MTAAAFLGLVDVGEPNVVKYVRKDQMEGEQMVIETERLLLRPWADADAPALYRMASDERVGPAAGWPVHESEDESLHIIRTVLSGGSVFCIELKETGSPAGCAGLTMPKDSFLEIDDDEAELGSGSIRPAGDRGSRRKQRWLCLTSALRRPASRRSGVPGLRATNVPDAFRKNAVLPINIRWKIFGGSR